MYSELSKCKFGPKFRYIISLCLAILIIFHVFVLMAPFVKYENSSGFYSDDQIKHLETVSNTISNVTVTLILIFLIVEGQKSISGMISRQRKETYAQTEEQIFDWLKITKSQVFDFEANLINSEPAPHQDILQNFKVEGSASKIIEFFSYNNETSQFVEEFCRNVHFEMTCYPSEIIYGIHIECDNYKLSQTIFGGIEEILNLSRQSKEFVIDNIIPKKPGWIFITKTISLEGDEDRDFPIILTHARHFVELVGHNYDLIYSKKLIDMYIKNKSGA